MRWRLILEEFGPNDHHIAGVHNVVAATISRFISAPSDKYNPYTSKAQCCANKFFVIYRVENNKDPPRAKYLNCTEKKTEKNRGIQIPNSVHTFQIKDTVTPRKILTR